MDWSGCGLVESVPGKVSGAPVIVGTRIFADTIAENYELGMSVEEIQADYPSLSEQTIVDLLEYERTHRPQLQL